MTTLNQVSHRQSLAVPAEGALFDMRQLDNPSRPANVFVLAVLVGLGAATYACHRVFYGDGFSEQALSVYCYLHLVVTVVWLLARIARPGPRNWLAPDVVFWIVFTMFHVPYIVLYLLGWAEHSYIIFHSDLAANRAMCCVVLSGIGFLLGYELGPLGSAQPAYFAPAERIPKSLFQGAQLCLMISLVAGTLITGIGAGAVVLKYGHAGLLSLGTFGVGAETQRWIGLSLGLLSITLVLYVAGCVLCHRKVTKGLVLPAMIATICLFHLLLGSRGNLVVLLLPLGVGRHYFVKRIRLWLGIPLFFAALFMFGALGISRASPSLSPGDLIRTYTEYRQDTGVSPFLRALAEAGGTIKTVNVACTYIPSHEPYWWGESLLNSALMIIPSPVAGLRTHLTPSRWATYMATGRMASYRVAGWGSSIAMEGYMNFGLLGGMAFLMAIGFMMRRIYDAMLRRPTYLRICLVIASVTAMALWCRNYSHHFFRPVVWTMIVAWLVWSVCGGAKARAGR